MDTATFAQKIKQKYPAYQSVDDALLVSKFVEKYPVYKSQITDIPTEPSFVENVQASVQDRSGNIEEITNLREQGQSVTGEVLEAVAPNVASKVSPLLERAQKLRQRIAPSQIAPIGQGAGLINDIIGAGLSAITPDAVKKFGTEAIQKVVPDVLAQAGIQTIEDYNTWATNNPLTAKNIEGVVNIASLLPTAGATKVAVEGVEQGAKAAGRGIAQAGAKAVSMADDVGVQVGKATAGAGKVVSDIVPTKSEFMSGQISKALDLTQGDLSNIKLATGNDVGDFIARNNLIGGSKDETIKAVKQLTDSQYKLVRDEIGKVKNVYSVNDIPKVKQSLSLLEKQLKGVPGLEDTYKQVKALAKKKTIELKDAQKVKELLDEQFSLFKATGDVKEGTIKKGLANVRKNIKEFIETEVKNTTGADIAQLNNDVSTGKSIMQLANKRSTRDFTRANVSLSDLGAFGGASVVATPLAGMAAVAVKRIIETPTVRLQIAKLINSLPKATQKAVQNELLDGKVPDVIEKAMIDYRLATNIKKNSPSSTKNASIPKASTKSATKSKGLSTELVQQAKKYKSAEEFVKSQPTVYRGEGGSNVAQGKALLAEGKHYASDAEYPKGFGKVEEYVLKPKAKVLDLGDSTFAEISQKLGIPERNYISPKELASIAKEKGYDVVKYTGEYKSTGKQFIHTVDLTGDSYITKSQLEDIWNKANKK